MIENLRTKASSFTEAVTGDSRWNLQDELMCQVFGFTLYGYLFGVGRLVCLLEEADIQQEAKDQLVRLGIGPGYVDGLIEAAHGAALDEKGESPHSQLVGIGHSHFSAESLGALVDSVFTNTELLR